MEGSFFVQEGYSRPDWKIIRRTIEERVTTEHLPQAWTEAALQWVLNLRSDLGGDYRVSRSEEFILLSSLDARAAAALLGFAEKTLKEIYSWLKDAAWRSGKGKHVILIFAEEDDYYQYVSYYYPDGVHPFTSGVLLHKDYVHVAMAYADGRHVRQILAHELAHNSVVHLRLPTWLNEGLAITIERTTGYAHRPVLDHDLRERHFAFWTAGNIQRFWAGVSFHEPGESNALSYSLAEIVVQLLAAEKGDFVGFVQKAHWNDAGQTAALDFFGADLEKIVGTFLGEGTWRPQPKALTECWREEKEASKKAAAAENADTSAANYRQLHERTIR